MASLTMGALQLALPQLCCGLTSEELAYLRVRVCDLDAKYASLFIEEELGMNVAISKAAVLLEIQSISQLISDCETELTRPSVVATRPPVAATTQDDSPLSFLENFLETVQPMASSGVPRDFSNSIFTGKYLPVRGDGNCGLRAFLTALAARAGRHLPNDPPRMLEWIYRLKPLMIQKIKQMRSDGIIDESNFLVILKNLLGKDATLEGYFAKFLTDEYHITNFDFRVLASMFNLQINVIYQRPNGYDDVQCFVRHGNKIDINIPEHICILQQPGHFVPLIQVDESSSSKSIQYLYNARCMGFTG